MSSLPRCMCEEFSHAVDEALRLGSAALLAPNSTHEWHLDVSPLVQELTVISEPNLTAVGLPTGSIERIAKTLPTHLQVLYIPAAYSAWNGRKRAFLKSTSVEAALVEIAMTSLVLSRHPKTPEVWAHRLWAVDECRKLGCHALAAASVSSASLRTISRAANGHSRNYPLWSTFATPLLWRRILSPDLAFQMLLSVSQYYRESPYDCSSGHFLLEGMSWLRTTSWPCEDLLALWRSVFITLTRHITKSGALVAYRLLCGCDSSSQNRSHIRRRLRCHERDDASLDDSDAPFLEGQWHLRQGLIAFALPHSQLITGAWRMEDELDFVSTMLDFGDVSAVARYGFWLCNTCL